MSQIWIIDDEPAICYALRTNLEEERHQVQVFSSAEPAFKALKKQQPDLILLDVRLPGFSGLEVLEKLKTEHPGLPVILMTAFGDLQTAVQAVQGEAFEYLTKPFDLETLMQAVRRALVQRQMRATAVESIQDQSEEPELILGKSTSMQSVYKQIARAASMDSTLLIEGEEGTGKNLVAVMVHRFSARQNLPMLSTTAIPGKDLEFEIELFGAGRPSSDALQPLRTGLLELAGEGTLLIDEVGAMSLANQLRLIRAIENHSFCRVGDTEVKQLRCRILFTSSHSISKLVSEGELDRRLASHLEVFKISLPPLRERPEDIAPMVRKFLQSKTLPQGIQITKSALEELQRRSWPGNVRELKLTIERSALKATGGIIQFEDLPPESRFSGSEGHASESQGLLELAVRNWTFEKLQETPREGSSDALGMNEDLPGTLYEDFLSAVEPSFLKTVLDHHSGNRAAAASILGLHRSTLRQKTRRYRLEPDK
ncbi:MAG: sigma-54 dependent transcriptional regulator [Planctomycetaceae bacterium]|jgi:two-component system nitrogen regulation response regulator GlnG|nr:sigma-54 dependent transcriptional regulator [Planctomycetaceae bacterium]